MTAVRAVTIVAYGDSITYGYPDPSVYRPWPELVREELARRNPAVEWRMVNAGMPGATTADGLEHLAEMVLRHGPQAVFLAFGSNDAYRPLPPPAGPNVILPLYRLNLQWMIGQIRDAVPDAAILLLSPPPRHPALAAGDEELRQYAGAAGQLARDEGCGFADAYGALAADDGSGSWQGDGVHLAAAGYERIAGAALAALQPCLETIIGGQEKNG